MLTPRRKWTPGAALLCLAGAALLSGCGWGYAAKKVKPLPEAPPAPEATPQPPPEQLPPQAQGVDERCPVRIFTLFKVEPGSRLIKDIGCDSGEVISLSKKDIGEDELRGYQAMNVPMEQWYILVDPAHQEQRHNYALTNQQFLKVSQKFPLKFYHRMPDNGFVIYVLNDAPPEP